MDPGQPGRFAVTITADEVTVDCTFSPVSRDGEHDSRPQTGRCVVSTGASMTVTVGDEDGGSDDGLRVFAGRRLDPFFNDGAALQKTITTARLSFTDPGTNNLDGKDVLSVVVELDSARHLGSPTMWAVIGETVIDGKIPVRWEHAGRPESENAVLAMKSYDTANRTIELRELFNADDAFDIATARTR